MGIKQKLEDLGACDESLAWVGDRDLDTAWAECPLGSWLVWILAEAHDFEAKWASEDAESPYGSVARHAAMNDWNRAVNVHMRVRAQGDSATGTANAIRLIHPAPTAAVRRMMEDASYASTTNPNATADTRED